MTKKRETWKDRNRRGDGKDGGCGHWTATDRGDGAKCDRCGAPPR